MKMSQLGQALRQIPVEPIRPKGAISLARIMRVRRPNVRSKAANMDQSDSEKPVGRAMVSVD
jgi:hypothetical protein